MKAPVSITAVASISPLGNSFEEVWQQYKNSDHFISKHNFEGNEAFAAFLPDKIKKEVESLRNSAPHLKSVDNSVLYAVLTSRQAMHKAGWGKGAEFGINIGSSRGATRLFEQYFKYFLEQGKAETLASPTTTLGNISSWVAQDLQNSGPDISHSVTCSTGLHSVINAVAWLQAGLADKFMAGGSEAALTPFTIAQMQAMKIYAKQELEFPCQALNLHKTKNSMVLGEAAAVICLESGKNENSLAQISGIGYATEKLKHSVSISANGKCFQKSMKMAIGNTPLKEIDAVVMHAPGTVKGDIAEMSAIKALFGERMPAVTSNKWKTGHTFGASGVLSLELGILMLRHQEFIPVPFVEGHADPNRLNNILVNAVGFGGNAVSILIQRG